MGTPSVIFILVTQKTNKKQEEIQWKSEKGLSST